MGLRLRKTLRLSKGLRVNISKTGLSLSIGGRGLTLNLSSKTGKTLTLGIPGTGLSYQIKDK